MRWRGWPRASTVPPHASRTWSARTNPSWPMRPTNCARRSLASEECARYDEIELEGQPVTVRGDPRLLRRMIRNLLENARRHGAPPIAVSVGRAGEGAEL